MTKRFVARLAAPLAVALLAAPLRAQEEQAEPGDTYQVGPERGAKVKVRAPGVKVDVNTPPGRVVRVSPDQEIAAEPSYWIGILGGDVSPELRAHLGPLVSDEETGVIVREVVDGSPAEEGGIKPFDILVRANGRPITGMPVLVEEVADVGPSRGQVTIELVRAGKRETKWIKPAERPATPAPVQPGFREEPAAGGVPGGGPGAGGGGGWGGWFGGEGGPLRLRVFGNGVQLGGNANTRVQVGGTSVSVSTVNGQTKVNVKRGDQEWNLDGADAETLEQLPPDVRAMVEGVLAGNGAGGVDINIDEMMPDLGELFGGRNGEGLFGGEGFRARRDRQLEEMRRQIEELQRRVGGGAPAPPAAAAPLDGSRLDEAPAFKPEPVEVTIPAEAEAETESTEPIGEEK